MQESSLRAVCAISLLTMLFALTGGDGNTAMDYIIKANMGKGKEGLNDIALRFIKRAQSHTSRD